MWSSLCRSGRYLLVVWTTSVMALEPYEVAGSLTTSFGLLSVKRGSEAECQKQKLGKNCEILDLAGRPLFTDYIVSIDAAFPSPADPKLVFIHHGTGGNSCCYYKYLIDLTRGAPIVVKNAPRLIPRGAKAIVDTLPEGITYQNYGDGEAQLGEPLWEVYRYIYGAGKVELLRSLPQYSYSPMRSKKYPSEVLNDPVRRAPLLRIMGEKDFVELRRRMQTEMPLEQASETIFLGRGCMAHSCGSSEGLFAIDIARNIAWAMYVEGESGKFFGSIASGDVIPKRFFEPWLNARKMTWRHFSISSGGSVASPAPAVTGARTEVRLVSESGVLKVPATLNGIIPLTFVVDSGAADVVIPADVVMTLIRTGTLNNSDFTGTKVYRLADGSTLPSTTFRIRALKVGNRVIENVNATMTGVEGSLLLGQSFLGRFQRWSINNSRQALELE